MHRLALQSTLLPTVQRYPRRWLTSSTIRNKTATDIDNAPAPSPSPYASTWSYPAPVRDEGGLLPESSRAAEERTRLLENTFWSSPILQEQAKSTTLRPDTRDGPIATVSRYRSSPVTPPPNPPPSLASRKHKPPDSSYDPPHPPPQPSNYTKTVADAMSRILDIHSQSSDLPPVLRPMPSATGKAKCSLLDESEQTEASEPDASRTKHAPLPPSLKALMDVRQHRLAVFHTLNNPHLASNVPVLNHLAHILALRSAGKLASRVRRMAKRVSAIQHGVRTRPLVMLEGLGGVEGRYEGYWDLPAALPPAKPSLGRGTQWDTLDKRVQEQQRDAALTAYFNTKLSFQLRQSSLSEPIAPLDSRHKSPTPGWWPPPKPSLRQLRHLLQAIAYMEKKRGFKPDRITANIILKCWLRCAQPPHPLSDPFRVRAGEVDPDVVVRKTPSGRVLQGDDLMLMFRLVGNIMELSMARTEQRLKKELKKLGASRVAELRVQRTWQKDATAAPTLHKDEAETSIMAHDTDGPLGSFDDLDWEKHIRPFAEMLILSLRKVQATEHLSDVLGWKKAMKSRAEAADKAKEVLVLARTERAAKRAAKRSDSDVGRLGKGDVEGRSG
jgi:hypothetical protein